MREDQTWEEGEKVEVGMRRRLGHGVGGREERKAA